MPNSALALGHEGLRLRSRRIRSDRSHRLSSRFVMGLLVLAGLAGFVGATWLLRWTSVADAAATDQQRYLAILTGVRGQVDESAMRIGLLSAQYAQGQISTSELEARLDVDLASLRRVDEQLSLASPPAELRSANAEYLSAVRLFEQAATELMQIADDRDSTHIAAAVPSSLDGMSQLQRARSDALPPLR